ncbi:hypothetical protein QYF36_007913 [Acer negundo]|nr:hypothetical protein QYF36_007913 [Acer negundo]
MIDECRRSCGRETSASGAREVQMEPRNRDDYRLSFGVIRFRCMQTHPGVLFIFFTMIRRKANYIESFDTRSLIFGGVIPPLVEDRLLAWKSISICIRKKPIDLLFAWMSNRESFAMAEVSSQTICDRVWLR